MGDARKLTEVQQQALDLALGEYEGFHDPSDEAFKLADLITTWIKNNKFSLMVYVQAAIDYGQL